MRHRTGIVANYEAEALRYVAAAVGGCSGAVIAAAAADALLVSVIIGYDVQQHAHPHERPLKSFYHDHGSNLQYFRKSTFFRRPQSRIVIRKLQTGRIVLRDITWCHTKKTQPLVEPLRYPYMLPAALEPQDTPDKTYSHTNNTNIGTNKNNSTSSGNGTNSNSTGGTT